MSNNPNAPRKIAVSDEMREKATNVQTNILEIVKRGIAGVDVSDVVGTIEFPELESVMLREPSAVADHEAIAIEVNVGGRTVFIPRITLCVLGENEAQETVSVDYTLAFDSEDTWLSGYSSVQVGVVVPSNEEATTAGSFVDGFDPIVKTSFDKESPYNRAMFKRIDRLLDTTITMPRLEIMHQLTTYMLHTS